MQVTGKHGTKVQVDATRLANLPVYFTYRFSVIDEWREAYGPDPDEIVEHVFVGAVDGGEPTLCREHDAWGGHVPEEPTKMLKWPNDIEALWRSEAFLSAKQ